MSLADDDPFVLAARQPQRAGPRCDVDGATNRQHEFPAQPIGSRLQVFRLTAAFCRLGGQSGRFVEQADPRFDLVAMLPARSATTNPFHGAFPLQLFVGLPGGMQFRSRWWRHRRVERGRVGHDRFVSVRSDVGSVSRVRVCFAGDREALTKPGCARRKCLNRCRTSHRTEVFADVPSQSADPRPSPGGLQEKGGRKISFGTKDNGSDGWKSVIFQRH